MAAGPTELASVQAMVADWPQDMMQKFGPPQEVTGSMLKWRNNGGWKWTTVSRDTTQHNFPMPHPDLLGQAIATAPK